MYKKLSLFAIVSIFAASVIYPYSALAAVPESAASLQSQVRVETDNGYVNVSNHKIIDGSTFIPISELAKVLKVQVRWEGSTHTVTIENDHATMKWNSITDTIKVNNKDVSLKELPQIFNNRTYVPLIMLQQVFLVKYDWDAATKTVTIVSPDDKDVA